MRTFRLIATFAAMLGGAAPSLAQQRTPIPSCSLGDTNWRSDPVFLRSQDPSARGRPGGALRCEQYDLSEYPVGDERFKVVVGRLFEIGEGVERLDTCSGNWGLVEIGEERGWRHGNCANQVTNCS